MTPNNNTKEMIEGQGSRMRGNEYLKKFEQFKIHSPWKFKENSGIDFLVVQALYNFNTPESFIIAPGVLNFKYQHATSIHFFIKPNSQEQQTTIEFDAGQPMLHFTPVAEKKLEIRRHLLDQQEYNKLEYKKVFFTNNYNKLKKWINKKKRSVRLVLIEYINSYYSF